MTLTKAIGRLGSYRDEAVFFIPLLTVCRSETAGRHAKAGRAPAADSR